jgi:hypothetical protein
LGAIFVRKQKEHVADIIHRISNNKSVAILVLLVFGEAEKADASSVHRRHQYFATLQVIMGKLWAGFTQAQPSRAVFPL